MPFGPTNARAFYTVMMKNFKEKWDNIFTITLLAMESFKGDNDSISAAQDVVIGAHNVILGSKVIIDDITLRPMSNSWGEE